MKFGHLEGVQNNPIFTGTKTITIHHGTINHWTIRPGMILQASPIPFQADENATYDPSHDFPRGSNGIAEFVGEASQAIGFFWWKIDDTITSWRLEGSVLELPSGFGPHFR